MLPALLPQPQRRFLQIAAPQRQHRADPRAGVAQRAEQRPIAEAHERRGLARRQQRAGLRDGDLRRAPLDHLIPLPGDRGERIEDHRVPLD